MPKTLIFCCCCCCSAHHTMRFVCHTIVSAFALFYIRHNFALVARESSNKQCMIDAAASRVCAQQINYSNATAVAYMYNPIHAYFHIIIIIIYFNKHLLAASRAALLTLSSFTSRIFLLLHLYVTLTAVELMPVD